VLATGCTIVLKPGEDAPLSSLRFAELCLEVGLPDGVINVVTGLGDTGAALRGASGCEEDRLHRFGSRPGQHVIRASAGNVKRLTLELGGKSPDIVFADADLAAGHSGSGDGNLLSAGVQLCVAGSRLFVERPIYDEFVARRLRDRRIPGRIGRIRSIPANRSCGPLRSELQLERVPRVCPERT